MSYCFRVQCDCFKKGSFKSIPEGLKPFVKLNDGIPYFHFPEDSGGILTLGEIIGKDKEYEKEYEHFVQWKHSACIHGHNDFTIVEFEISNSNLSLFGDFLRSLDADTYPLNALDDDILIGEMHDIPADLADEYLKVLSNLRNIIESVDIPVVEPGSKVEKKDLYVVPKHNGRRLSSYKIRYYWDSLIKVFEASRDTCNPVLIG
jgi:hypothetical protein